MARIRGRNVGARGTTAGRRGKQTPGLAAISCVQVLFIAELLSIPQEVPGCDGRVLVARKVCRE